MIENPLEQVLGGDLFGLGFISNEQAMAEDVVADGLDVVRSDVAAAVQESMSLGGARQEDRGPRAGAVLDVLRQLEPEGFRRRLAEAAGLADFSVLKQRLAAVRTAARATFESALPAPRDGD